MDWFSAGVCGILLGIIQISQALHIFDHLKVTSGLFAMNLLVS